MKVCIRPPVLQESLVSIGLRLRESATTDKRALTDR